MPIAFNCKTHKDLKIVYVRFDLDKTSFIFLFFKSLIYYLNCLCDTLFNMHETFDWGQSNFSGEHVS